jgi:ferric-dicitrate binding protein FerR (iron transport regulator)
MFDDHETDAVFSLERRREMEREQHEARRESYARAERVLGCLVYERRLAEAQEELKRAEREAWARRTGGQLAGSALSGKIAILKEQLKRLISDDGPTLRSATFDVARAIESPAGETGHAPEPHGPVNGNGRARPLGGDGGRWG